MANYNEDHTVVRSVQEFLNNWYANRNIPYPYIAVDGIKGRQTNIAIERFLKCLGVRFSSNIDQKLLSYMGKKPVVNKGQLQLKALASRRKITAAQRVRGVAYRARLRRYLKSLQAKHPPMKVYDLYNEMLYDHNKDYPYVFGGGHSYAGRPSHGGYDCSGSVGAVLARARGFGIKVGEFVSNSTWFANSWGQPGEGKYLTIWANADHVWIEIKIPGVPYTRYDTSPWGTGGSGPELRTGSRTKNNFAPRHWPGT